MLRSLGRISDFKVDNRRERLLPLLVGAVCYVLCAITIAKIPSAIFLRKFMIAAACCEVLCFVVSSTGRSACTLRPWALPWRCWW